MNTKQVLEWLNKHYTDLYGGCFLVSDDERIPDDVIDLVELGSDFVLDSMPPQRIWIFKQATSHNALT